MKCRFIAALLFALSLGVACYPEVESEPGPNLLCEADDACPTGQACISGLCGVTSTEPRDLAFRLLPTPSSGYRPQIVDLAPIDPARGIDIGMEASVEVVGSVRRGGDGSGVSGTLVFERMNARAPDSVQVTASPDGTFEALLSPGSYRATMLPEDELIPPFVWTGLDYRLDTAWDFSMPGESLTRSITISTDLPAASSLGELSRELLAARIVAVSRDTGVSSTAVDFVPASTDDGSPRGTLQVFADSGAYDLRITPASPNSLVPAATLEKAFVCEDTCYSTLSGSEGAEIVSVKFEQDFRTLTATSFALTQSSAESVDWSSVRVRVTRPLEDGEIVVRPEITDDGVFTVQSLAGEYTIDVITPSDSPIASRRFSGVGLYSGTDLTDLEMTSKKRLSGTVSDVNGDPVGEARIELTPTAANVGQFARPLVVSTDAEGAFSLWLEPGEYWVAVIPLSSGKPRFVTQIDDETDSGAVEWQLSEPTVVFGSVFGAPPSADDGDEAWKPVADVTVQVLERLSDEYIVVGEGTTSSKGGFRIAVRTSQ